jgi:7,8-dihydropterin-6-yl-methyl-4-(beta-D-ribofuranosyl)aminobenzene 5'-phosphate synthase
MHSLEMDSLRLVVVVDNETDALSSVDGGVPQISELSHLLASTPVSRTTSEGYACHDGFEHLCVACHGFSVLATARRGAEEHTMLFDVGPHGSVWRENAARLASTSAASPLTSSLILALLDPS